MTQRFFADDHQSDQMNRLKNRPKCIPTPFWSKLMHNLYCGKSSPTIWATSVIFNKLARVNNHTLGENLPNLVALIVFKLRVKDSSD
jgi:hypothetical protein